MANSKVKIRLQGHEKFALRDGWLNKGLEIIPQMSDFFLRKDATDYLGIGSNMVKSLRYWMKALGLTNENGSELSELGELLLKHDPYLEDTFSWWIMHSVIAKNKAEATSWYLFFNHCDADDLDKEQIVAVLKRELSKYAAGQPFSEKSMENDVDVILNMYGRKKDNSDPEDKNVSPFSQLGLIKNIEGKYYRSHPDKKKYNELIVLYEIALLLQDHESLSIEDAIDGENGLSKIYNLSSVAANEYLDRLDALGYLRVDRTAGLDMIYPVDTLDPSQILEGYYKKHQ